MEKRVVLARIGGGGGGSMDVGGGEVKAKSRRRVGRRWLSLAQPQRLADRDQGDEEKLFTGKERSSKKERQGRWYTTRSRTLTQLLVSPHPASTPAPPYFSFAFEA